MNRINRLRLGSLAIVGAFVTLGLAASLPEYLAFCFLAFCACVVTVVWVTWKEWR